MKLNQYQVMMLGATHVVTIMSPIGSLYEQWQFMRRNDVHTMFDGKQIVMNYQYIVSVVGPNSPFSSMDNNPFERSM